MLLTSFIALVLICTCIIINIYGRVADNEIQKFTPQIECSAETITIEEALKDFERGDD